MAYQQNHIEKMNAALIAAARVNNLPDVRKALAAGADINTVLSQTQGYTPLYMACMDNAWDVAVWLVKNGADIHEEDMQRKTALHSAVASLDKDMDGAARTVLAIVDRGFKDGQPAKDLWRPLYIAVRRGNFALADALLAQGIDINIRDGENMTPLMRLAESAGDTEACVHYLLSKGANASLRNPRGQTALDIAIACADDIWEGPDTDFLERTISVLESHALRIRPGEVKKIASLAAAPLQKPIPAGRHGKLAKGPRPK